MNLTFVHHRLTTPLGPMDVLASDAGVRGLWFEDQRHRPDPSVWVGLARGAQHPAMVAVQAALEAYWSGAAPLPAWPVDTNQGTDFQRAVWQALRGIPSGQTTTYGALAQGVGRPLAVRAVGAAVGRNPWSVLVPCHRVLGRDGALTGYAGGLARKVALLDRERTCRV